MIENPTLLRIRSDKPKDDASLAALNRIIDRSGEEGKRNGTNQPTMEESFQIIREVRAKRRKRR